MNSPDELRQENAALRERISMLNAAILRISASLDLDTVLREVVDGARALTGARYGMIATVDDTGTIREFVASGLSADERRHMAEWPHGYRFFEHLRDLPGALRLADVPACVRSLGYSEELTLSKTLQATPMRHRGGACRQLLSRREGGRAGVHGRGRGGPGAVRLAGGDGDRQRPHAPRRAAGPGRPGGPGRHLAGRGGGVRCQQRPAGVVQALAPAPGRRRPGRRPHAWHHRAPWERSFRSASRRRRRWWSSSARGLVPGLLFGGSLDRFREEDAALSDTRTTNGRDLFSGSSFLFAAGDAAGPGGRWSGWGQAATLRFDSVEGVGGDGLIGLFGGGLRTRPPARRGCPVPRRRRGRLDGGWALRDGRGADRGASLSASGAHRPVLRLERTRLRRR